MKTIREIGARACRMKPWQIDLPVVLAICLVTVGAYLLLLRPMARRRADFIEQKDLLSSKRRQASQLKAASLAQREHLVSTGQSLESKRIDLQSTDSLNRQVARIADLLSECNLRTDDIQPGRVSERGTYNIVPIALTGKGGYTSCASFFHRITQALPDTGVSSFELSGDPGRPGDGGNFRLELRWYTAATEAGREG